MGALGKGLAVVIGVIAILAAGVYALSEYGGEVVILHTTTDDGKEKATHLWIVDDAGFAWVRAGQPESRWFQRLLARPRVELVRAGETRAYRANVVSTAAAREHINQLIAEKYGIAETIISLIHNEDEVTPIRLEPLDVAASPSLE